MENRPFTKFVEELPNEQKELLNQLLKMKNENDPFINVVFNNLFNSHKEGEYCVLCKYFTCNGGEFTGVNCLSCKNFVHLECAIDRVCNADKDIILDEYDKLIDQNNFDICLLCFAQKYQNKNGSLKNMIIDFCGNKKISAQKLPKLLSKKHKN